MSPVQESITKDSLTGDGRNLFENDIISAEIIIVAAIKRVDLYFIK
jgi:hypothetical protein